MGWGDAFAEGMNQGATRVRQSRLDLLNAEIARKRLALEEAAAARADAAARERSMNAGLLRDRMGYLDRMKVLGRNTQPLATLLGKMPGAGAAPNVDEAFRLDDLLAREPARAEERTPLVRDGQLTGPWAPESTPTFQQERQRQITAAYDKFGAEQDRLQQALEALKLKLGAQRAASAKPAIPFTRDLDIKLRAVEAKKKQAQQMIAGQETLPNGALMDIMDPGRREAVKAQGQAMLSQAIAEEAQLSAAYGARIPDLGGGSPRMGPAAAVYQLESMGLDAEQIAEQLRTMFSPQELEIFGQTRE